MARSTSSEIDALNEFLKIFKPDYKSRTLTFYVNGEAVGVVSSFDSAALGAQAPGMFRIDVKRGQIHLISRENSNEITQALAALLKDLREKNVFRCLRGWRNEMVGVSQKFGEKPLFLIERAATSLFGIKRYGVHINGFVKKNDEIEFVWLQRRAKTKPQFPGVLDILVSGGLEAGLTPFEAMLKECHEEASICEQSCRKHVKSTGTVSFVYEDNLGTHPLTFFCFDANLPHDFEPKANDGEVEEFVQMSVRGLLEIVTNPERFKATSAPTVLDFLVRHHVIDSSYASALINTTSAIHQDLQEQYPL